MKIGEKMPSFILTDQFGKDWSNEELAGCRTVIYAYPKDSTPGCTAEACDIRDNYERFLRELHNITGFQNNVLTSNLCRLKKQDIIYSTTPAAKKSRYHISDARMKKWAESFLKRQ